MSKPKKPFSKREVIILCICLLLFFIIVFLAFNSYATGIFDEILSSWFTIVTSIVCSIIATALLPRVLQSNYTNDSVNLLNQTKSVVPYVYNDTNDPNIDFNERMNDSISRTVKYYYFSDRALYLSKRLAKDINKTNERLEIIVLLADVMENNLFASRIDVYRQRERAKNKNKKKTTISTDDEIILNEKLEILRSMYALGQLKKKYNIRLYVHRELPFIRYEITDDLMAMSFLTQLASGKTYPSTLLYENNSVFKTNFLDYTHQIVSRSRLVNDNELTIESLVELAKNAGIMSCKPEDITKYYNSLK